MRFFAADTTQAGVISLFYFGAEGAPVVFYERVGDKLQRLGTRTAPPGERTATTNAVAWRCARLVRRFEATATLPDGTRTKGAYSVRTPSCATRLSLGVPRRVAKGKTGRIRVVDRWDNGGVSPTLCITAPNAKRDCQTVRLRRAVSVATRRFRATRSGRWQVELRIRGHRVRRSVAVGSGTSSAPPPTVLATGDSTMQGIDSFLADELGDRATVRSDLRPSTAFSKPGGPWANLPQVQTRRLKQSVTVVSIGANEGFPLTTPAEVSQECCGVPWIAEYSRRVRRSMRSYRREGRGRVLWLTLPVPRGRRDITDAVNFAIVKAAEGLEDVTVLRMDQLFSPNGFSEVIRYRGRNVRVREADGIHLNIAGTAIAANVVAAALIGR